MGRSTLSQSPAKSPSASPGLPGHDRELAIALKTKCLSNGDGEFQTGVIPSRAYTPGHLSRRTVKRLCRHWLRLVRSLAVAVAGMSSLAANCPALAARRHWVAAHATQLVAVSAAFAQWADGDAWRMVDRSSTAACGRCYSAQAVAHRAF